MKNSSDAPMKAVPSCTVILVSRRMTNGRFETTVRSCASGGNVLLERSMVRAPRVNTTTHSIAAPTTAAAANDMVE